MIATEDRKMERVSKNVLPEICKHYTYNIISIVDIRFLRFIDDHSTKTNSIQCSFENEAARSSVTKSPVMEPSFPALSWAAWRRNLSGANNI